MTKRDKPKNKPGLSKGDIAFKMLTWNTTMYLKKITIFSALRVNAVESTVNKGNTFKWGESCKDMNDYHKTRQDKTTLLHFQYFHVLSCAKT